MPASVHRGIVVYRTWAADGSLTEQRQGFATLDELFDLCLQAGERTPIDRVVIQGRGVDGEPRTLVLGFMSLSRADEAQPAG